MKISATSLKRTLYCPGSYLLTKDMPRPVETETQLEGNAAHEAAYAILCGQFQLAEELVDRRMSNGVYITRDMVDDLEEYITEVTGWTAFENELVANIPTADGPTEIKGIADAYDVTDKLIKVADLKYGWRPVEVYPNFQLIAYGIALIDMYPEAEAVEMIIHQPRPWHRGGKRRAHTMLRGELEDYRMRIARVLNESDWDETKTGEHCRYCLAAPTCQAFTQAAYNAIDTAHQAGTDDYDPDALSRLVSDLRRGQAVIKEKLSLLEDNAVERVKKGMAIPGYTIKESKGNYTWNNGFDADAIKALTGIDPTEPKLITPAQLKKRGADKDVVAAITHRPTRGFKLVDDTSTERDAERAFSQAQKGK